MKPGLPINGNMISRFHERLAGGIRCRVDVLERAEVSRVCREGRFLYARVSVNPADTLRYKAEPYRRTRRIRFHFNGAGSQLESGSTTKPPTATDVCRLTHIYSSWSTRLSVAL